VDLEDAEDPPDTSTEAPVSALDKPGMTLIEPAEVALSPVVTLTAPEDSEVEAPVVRRTLPVSASPRAKVDNVALLSPSKLTDPDVALELTPVAMDSEPAAAPDPAEISTAPPTLRSVTAEPAIKLMEPAAPSADAPVWTVTSPLDSADDLVLIRTEPELEVSLEPP
jgi:hypothetical protein